MRRLNSRPKRRSGPTIKGEAFSCLPLPLLSEELALIMRETVPSVTS
jgi:hypothetical protein